MSSASDPVPEVERLVVDPRHLELLSTGVISVQGRIMPASNQTFLCTLGRDGDPEEEQVPAVYKPISGEKPLWDFPDGTLAMREYAAYLVSEHLGWDVVPPTTLRDGPVGTGMVQLWREPDPAQESVDIVAEGQVPEGYLHVLDAMDGADSPVSLIHEDTGPLRRMALFDVVVNNTDRKGGHVLAMADGHRFGIDHGVCFHVEDKLRTVLWGWAGEPLTDEEVTGLVSVVAGLRGRLGECLEQLLAPVEVRALRRRCEMLLRRGQFPTPQGGWPVIPWPPF